MSVVTKENNPELYNALFPEDNEIKENVEPTLEYLKICVEDDISFETTNYKALLDYITNLQESEAYYYGQYKDYKSRNEKAIEYHNNCIENLELSKIDDNEKLAYQVAYEIHKNYIDILQGSDKDE